MNFQPYFSQLGSMGPKENRRSKNPTAVPALGISPRMSYMNFKITINLDIVQIISATHTSVTERMWRRRTSERCAPFGDLPNPFSRETVI